MGKLLDPNPDFYEIRKEYPSVFRKTSYGCFAGFEKAAFGKRPHSFWEKCTTPSTKGSAAAPCGTCAI